MNEYLHEIFTRLQRVRLELNTAKPEELRIHARKIAMIELELQAFRSLLEARIFQGEIDQWERDIQRNKAV